MKKEENKIKAIIFDIGGVLALGNNPVKINNQYRSLGVHQYISKKLKITLDQWFDAIYLTYADAVEGKISGIKAISIIAKNLNKSKRKLEKIIIKGYKKNYKKNKSLYRLAFKLKKQGYKIAILSDQWYLSNKALYIEKYLKKFNTVIISYKVKTRKPKPKIYKLTLRKLKIKPEQALFIDNQIWNTKPAKKLGFKTIVFKNNKQLFQNLKKLKILK